MNPKFGINNLQILQGQSAGFHFLISRLNLQGTSYFEFQKVFASKCLVPNTFNWIYEKL